MSKITIMIRKKCRNTYCEVLTLKVYKLWSRHHVRYKYCNMNAKYYLDYFFLNNTYMCASCCVSLGSVPRRNTARSTARGSELRLDDNADPQLPTAAFKARNPQS